LSITSSSPPRVLHPFPTRRSSDLQAGRHILDRAQVRGDVLAGGAIAARGALRELAIDIAQVHRQAIELHLGRKARLLHVELLFRSEEHTSELQSRENLVCRLLLEK